MATQIVMSAHQVDMLSREKAEGTSRYRGVHSYGRRWRASIKFDGNQEYLGIYDSEIDAARAYDERARVLHGPYARLNFPKVED